MHLPRCRDLAEIREDRRGVPAEISFHPRTTASKKRCVHGVFPRGTRQKVDESISCDGRAASARVQRISSHLGVYLGAFW